MAGVTGAIASEESLFQFSEMAKTSMNISEAEINNLKMNIYVSGKRASHFLFFFIKNNHIPVTA